MLEREGFIAFLEYIVENIEDSTTKGIAKLAIERGVGFLSDRQRYTLENGLVDYVMLECPNCGEQIEFDDMEIAMFNGRCGYCQHRYERIMSE